MEKLSTKCLESQRMLGQVVVGCSHQSKKRTLKFIKRSIHLVSLRNPKSNLAELEYD